MGERPGNAIVRAARDSALDHLALDAAREIMAVPATKPVDKWQHQARVQVIVREAMKKALHFAPPRATRA